MSKILFYDLETTGVNYAVNGIHQLSAVVDINGEVVETINLKIRPFNEDVIEEKALEVGKVTKEMIMQYEPPLNQKAKIDGLCSKYVDRFNKQDKFHLAGYNIAGFDNQFFRRYYEKCGDKYFGSNYWSDCLDVMVLASYKLQNHRHVLENFKLATVAKYCGIEVDDSATHDALYDVMLTRKIYYKLFFKRDV